MLGPNAPRPNTTFFPKPPACELHDLESYKMLPSNLLTPWTLFAIIDSELPLNIICVHARIIYDNPINI